MNRLLKKMAGGLLLGLLPIAGTATAQAADTDLPLIMTLKTNIYGYSGPDNYFTIYLGSTEENVEVYVESPKSQEYVTVNPYSLGLDEDGDNAVIASAIPLSVTETDNEVRVYGDINKIDYIDVHGCYITSVELAGVFPNLTVIDLSHNELTEIDLSPQTSLASIDLRDNSFTDPSKMVIGTNHPDLIILSVGLNAVCDPQLDLRNFPYLQYFSGQDNYGITSIDPTGCPNLVSLVLDVTNVSSLDLSNNPNLDVLNISQTKINSIDLSHNTKLGELYVNHEGTYNNEPQYKLTSIDLSNNPLISRIDLGGNLLSSIDLTKNPEITMLYLQRNLISSIDLSNNNKISSINLSNNLFTFATLPLPKEGWDYYYYRSPLSCDLKYKVGSPIDFSSSVIRAPYIDSEGNTVTPETYAIIYAVPNGKDEYEVDESIYTFKDGVFVFNQAVPDSVYARFHCTVFEEWDLATQNFMVKTVEDYDAPSAAFSFTPTAEMAGKNVMMSLGASSLVSSLTYPAEVTIIAGGSKVTAGTVTGASMPTRPNITFTIPADAQEVTVAMPDGYAVTSIGITGVALQSIDLSPATGLQDLRLSDCGLKNIDLAYNRALTNLDLSNNNLEVVDLAGIRGDYEKYNLVDINLANNKLKNLETVSAATISNLNLSGNEFTQFDLKYYEGLKTIDLSDNKISGALDFSNVEKLEQAILKENNINSLTFNSDDEALDNLTYLNVADNNLTFSTLPSFNISGLEYVYVPQSKMQVLSTAPAINLTSQNIVNNGKGTTYTWLYTETGQPVPSTEYSNEGGATKFSETLVGTKVYCEMTNPAYPAFDASPLTTTDITVASTPTVLVASLTTPESGTASIGFQFANSLKENAVYVDWRGDGSEYEPYIYSPFNSDGIYRTGQTFAGATAKVYVYENAQEVTGLFTLNTPLSSADLSPMTGAIAVDLHSAGLTDGSLILPETDTLTELVLDGNKFSEEVFSGFSNLRSLTLAGNQYKSIDLSQYPSVMFFQLDNNMISDVKFGSDSNIYQLMISNNNISELSLEGADGIQELVVSNNNLTELDLTPVASTLRILYVSGNNMTFKTINEMVKTGGESLTTLDYFGQKPMEVACIDYKIDLSDQAEINGTATEYLWFLGDFQGDVYYDYEAEQFVGESLEGPEDSDDPEYTVDNGITTFNLAKTSNVIGVMTNTEYPSLILYTTPTQVAAAGIESLFDTYSDGMVDVITLSGLRVKTHVPLSEALRNLTPGIYIIGGKKVLVK